MRELRYNILELIQFCLRHRKNKVFKGWTPQQIGWGIERALNHKGFAMAIGEDGNLAGICLSTPDHEARVLHVHDVLCIRRGALPAMLLKCKEWFPGYTIAAQRKGCNRVYKTPRLIHLLERRA